MIAEVGLGKLVFRGPDRQRFLHGLVTCDVMSLGPGRGLPGCVLTPKGRLVACFTLYDRGEDLLAVHSPRATAPMLGAFSKPVILSRTSIEDAGDAWAVLQLLGPEAGRLAGDLFSRVVDPSSFSCEPARWEGAAVWLLTDPWFGLGGVRVLAPAAAAGALRRAVLEAGGPCRWVLAGRGEMEVLRAEAGVPELGVDTDEQSLPLELGLEEAISGSKGCYLGQEAVGRLRNLGHVNRRLVGLRLEAPAPAGSAVFHEGRPVGRATTVVRSPILGASLALATVRVEAGVPSAELRVGSAERGPRARVVALPLRRGATAPSPPN